MTERGLSAGLGTLSCETIPVNETSNIEAWLIPTGLKRLNECVLKWVCLYFQIHQIPSKGAESISALAVAIGCGVAAAIVGTATVAFIARKILGKKSTNYELLRTPIRHKT